MMAAVDGRRRPDCAVWEFTLACNLRCSHCGSSAGIPRDNELSTMECMSLCEDLASVGTDSVALMGGEPFMRDDWFDVATCARQLGMKVNIVTNGTTMDKHIDKLSRLEPQVVGVSVDGMRQAHEAIRGSGTWDATIGAIDLMREHGIQTTVITTVSKANYRDLPKMHQLLLDKKVNWQIQTAMPFGNFRRELTLSEEEFYATALFIAKQRVVNKFDDFPVVGAHCYGYFSKAIPSSRWSGCTAGISTVGITSDGGIVGCLSMGNDRYIEGNVRQRKFSDIWTDPGSFAYNRKFEESQLGENCRKCKYGVKCRGGCSSVSLSLTGKLHNNPYCFRRIERERRVSR